MPGSSLARSSNSWRLHVGSVFQQQTPPELQPLIQVGPRMLLQRLVELQGGLALRSALQELRGLNFS